MRFEMNCALITILARSAATPIKCTKDSVIGRRRKGP